MVYIFIIVIVVALLFVVGIYNGLVTRRLYTTYTTNDQEARYILTPALQQRIMEMNKVFSTQLGDKHLSMSFRGSRLLIAVPSKTNRFEVKFNLAEVKKDLLALSTMIDVIEQLNLNLRIWSKE